MNTEAEEERTQIKTLLKAVVRNLYQKPDMDPGIKIVDRDDRIGITVDVTPWNPGLLIGERGSMKFALELLIAYGLGLDEAEGAVSIFVIAESKERVDRTSDRPADGERIREVAEAISEILGGTVDVETAKTAVMAMFRLPTDISRDVKPPLSKVIRSCGKACGFSALPYVQSIS